MPEPAELTRVRRATQKYSDARQEYDEAIFAASEAGLSSTRIAEAAGVTEAAIRLRIKRKQEASE